jgi:hypothetical protein
VNLPNGANLVVEREKITEYLLNPSHIRGGAKARFFVEFGFERERWEILAAALQKHGAQNQITTVVETGFGPRYTVTGSLTTPSGNQPNVITVWQMDHGSVAPRLITAYPAKKI